MTAQYFFLSCGFYLLSFSSFFFLSPIPSGRRLRVYHTSTRTNLECRSEMCCARLAENLEIQDAKKSPKNRHLRTVAQFARLYLCNYVILFGGSYSPSHEERGSASLHAVGSGGHASSTCRGSEAKPLVRRSGDDNREAICS